MSDCIHESTRVQATADNGLVDVSAMACEAGFIHPVGLTRAVWEQCVRMPDSCIWQYEAGRVWDILQVLRFEARSNAGQSEVGFVVTVRNKEDELEEVGLKAVCGRGGYIGEPVIRVRLRWEQSCDSGWDGTTGASQRESRTPARRPILSGPSLAGVLRALARLRGVPDRSSLVLQRYLGIV